MMVPDADRRFRDREVDSSAYQLRSRRADYVVPHILKRQLLCWWLVTALTFAPASCSPTSHSTEETSSDLSEVYDEYPVVVPKRAALLLDRLMVALEKAVESEAAEKGATNRIIPQDDTWKMDLQRRGQKNGRTYWRCYFNAVTCF